MNKPQILLLGDSIRLGYCQIVKELLKDEYEVIFPETNCRCTHFTLESLEFWASLCDRDRIAAVHFNNGQWDAARFGGAEEEPLTSLPVYSHNIERIASRLKKYFPDALIAYATTTPMNPGDAPCGSPRTTDEIREYNRIGTEVMDKMGIPVDDLFAVSEPLSSEYFADCVHFNEEGYRILGETVAEFLRTHLNK